MEQDLTTRFASTQRFTHARGLVEDYVQNARVERLIDVVDFLVDQVIASVEEALPIRTGQEIKKYLTSSKKAVHSIGQSWILAKELQIRSAAAEVYYGLNNASAQMLPRRKQRREAYHQVWGVVDPSIAELNKRIIEVSKKHMQTPSCYRRIIARKRVKPSICPRGYRYNGRFVCYRSGRHTEGELDEREQQLDAAAQAKRRKGRSIPANCVDKRWMKHGRWCYSHSCPAGYAKVRSFKRCESKCPPGLVGHRRMCGRSKNAINRQVDAAIAVGAISGTGAVGTIFSGVALAGCTNLGACINSLISTSALGILTVGSLVALVPVIARARCPVNPRW